MSKPQGSKMPENSSREVVIDTDFPDSIVIGAPDRPSEQPEAVPAAN
jgi:hypothetical protein